MVDSSNPVFSKMIREACGYERMAPDFPISFDLLCTELPRLQAGAASAIARELKMSMAEAFVEARAAPKWRKEGIIERAERALHLLGAHLMRSGEPQQLVVATSSAGCEEGYFALRPRAGVEPFALPVDSIESILPHLHIAMDQSYEAGKARGR